MRIVRWLVLAAVLVVLAPMAASAQDVARARALFEEGLEAARGERWEDARAAFRESLSIAERPSTLVNLAGAEVETGHLVEGAETYRRFLEVATAPRDQPLRAPAEAALRDVEARIPHATISIDGTYDRAELDGEPLARSVLGRTMALDPGAHVVVVTRGGEEAARRAFETREGESIDVAVVVLAPEAPAPMDEVIAVPVEPSRGSDDGLWIGLGVGLGAAVVLGVVLGVVVATTPSAPAIYQGNFGDGVIRF